MTTIHPMLQRALRLLRQFRLPRSTPAVPRPEPAPADGEEPQRGCGWFDSSHELNTGLVVLEHASADAVAAALPLGDWLALHLGGWQAGATAALEPA